MEGVDGFLIKGRRQKSEWYIPLMEGGGGLGGQTHIFFERATSFCSLFDPEAFRTCKNTLKLSNSAMSC